MENQANSKSIILNYGLYYGIVSVILSVILYAMGKHLEQGIGMMVLGFGVMIAFIILGIKKFKSDNGGFLAWGQSLKIGIGIVLIGALIAIVYQQIFINFIEPDFMTQVGEKTRQTLYDAGLTQEQIESQMEMQQKFQGPLISSALTLVGAAFFGFVFSAIAGAIMKKSEEDQY